MRLLVLIAAALVASPAFADFHGLVVGVTDGDTIKALRDGVQVKIRLAEIDAPERSQPYGDRSKQNLARLVFGRDVFVREHSTDRYGRTIGRIYVGSTDANAEQVRAGMAWVYDRYVSDRTLYALQDAARSAKAGLWADPSPIPPWAWRKATKAHPH